MTLPFNAWGFAANLTVLEEKRLGQVLDLTLLMQEKSYCIFDCCCCGFDADIVFSFGVIANIALIFNVIFLIAALSFLEATLTLPGIAGIALTIGMAVDANVLIFERIKRAAKQ